MASSGTPERYQLVGYKVRPSREIPIPLPFSRWFLILLFIAIASLASTITGIEIVDNAELEDKSVDLEAENRVLRDQIEELKSEITVLNDQLTRYRNLFDLLTDDTITQIGDAIDEIQSRLEEIGPLLRDMAPEYSILAREVEKAKEVLRGLPCEEVPEGFACQK